MRLRAHPGLELLGGIARAPSESSSASRSVEAIGDTGLPSPSAAPARISSADRLGHQPADAERQQQRRATAAPRPTRGTASRPRRSWPSTSDSGAQAATRQPVSRDQWKACSERWPSKSVVRITPSGRSAYCRTDSSGTGRPRNSLAVRVRAMLTFLRSATAASQPGGRLSPVQDLDQPLRLERHDQRIWNCLARRARARSPRRSALGDGALEEIRHVGLAGLPRDARQVGLGRDC